jgi:TonB family protein
MNRLAAMTLLVVLLSLPSSAQDDGAKLKATPSARIKNIRTERVSFQNQVEGSRVIASVASYNEDGNVIESTVSTETGAVFAKYVARYDDGGNLEEETYTDSKGDVGAHYLWKADSPARRLEVLNTKTKAASPAKIVYALDDTGHVIEETFSDKDGKTNRRIVIKRDAQGHLSESLEYDGKNQLTDRTVETHTNGLLAESLVYDRDGVNIRRSVYQRDAKGNVTEETLYNVGVASQWRSAYVYDEQGKWIKQSVTKLVKRTDQLVHEPSEIIYRTISYDTQTTASPGKRRKPQPYTDEALPDYGTVAIKRLEPQYPDAARRQRIGGHITVQVLVDEQGNVASSRALPQGNALLKEAASDAAWYWKFNPTLRGGLSRRGFGTIVFNFNP